jgi:hypothetical protein
MNPGGFFVRLSTLLPLLICGFSALFCAGASAANLPMTDKVDELTRQARPGGAKIIVLNVWGQTCSRCLLEMPTIIRAVAALKDNSDVAFVGLCIPDDDPAKNKATVSACSKIAEKKQLNYPNFIWSGDADPLTNKFNITGTPYNCLMSANGKVLTELDIPEGDKEKAYAYVVDAINKALKGSAPAPVAPPASATVSAEIIEPPDRK